MSKIFGEQLLGTLSYERSKTWSSFFKNCLDKEDGKEVEFSEINELFPPEDKTTNNNNNDEAEEDDVKDDLNKSTQCLTNTELTLLLCREDQNKILSQTLPILEEHERKWKQAGLDRILNTFDAEKIEQHVGGWLRRHNNSKAALTAAEMPSNQIYSSSHSNESDAESMHSMDTARYIRASRKHNIATKSSKSSSSLTTIKMYRTLPRKRAELRAKYACQAADDLHEEQKLRHRMQSLLHRRIREPRHHLHSVGSVSFNGQQRRKKLRKRRYTSPAAAATASSSSGEDGDSGAAESSYCVYGYHSEYRILPAPWLTGSGGRWSKRKTSSPALRSKKCSHESEASAEDLKSSPRPVNCMSRSPENMQKQLPAETIESIYEQSDCSEDEININKRLKEKRRQLKVIEYVADHSKQANRSTRSPVGNQQSQDSDNCKLRKRQLHVLETDEKQSKKAMSTTRSPVTKEQKDSLQNLLNVSKRMKVIETDEEESKISSSTTRSPVAKQDFSSEDEVNISITKKKRQLQSKDTEENQTMPTTRSSVAKQRSDSSRDELNITRSIKKKQMELQSKQTEENESNKAISISSPVTEQQSDSSEDAINIIRRMKGKQMQLQVKENTEDQFNQAMPTKRSPVDEHQSSSSNSRRIKEKQKQSASLSPKTRFPATESGHVIDALSDSSEDAINISRSSLRHSQNHQQILDDSEESNEEHQAILGRTPKGILLHKPAAAEDGHKMRLSANQKFVLTIDVLSPIIGRRKASRFMKYHISGRSYDAQLHVYYRPSERILSKLKDVAIVGDLDSSSCSESNEEVFEMLGRYGSIAVSNT